LIALIGADWHSRINEADDPVRMEIETALANKVPVLPVLIGNTTMPGPDELPESIASIAMQNAIAVGVLHDFHSHMQLLLPKIESILGAMAGESTTAADPQIVRLACSGIVQFLIDRVGLSDDGFLRTITWHALGTDEFERMTPNAGTFYLHRVTRLAELLELHFIISCWGHASDVEYLLAGWVMSELERTPVIPAVYFADNVAGPALELKVRRSDEDARKVWKMVTDQPLRLSLSYIATIAPVPST
jgi:hypothetical protein